MQATDLECFNGMVLCNVITTIYIASSVASYFKDALHAYRLPTVSADAKSSIECTVLTLFKKMNAFDFLDSCG